MSVIKKQINVCRCCLNNIGEYDLKIPFGIIVEPPNAILLKYFGINLVQQGENHMLCEECAQKIVNIYKFHKQIKLCEQKYKQLLQQLQNDINTDEYTCKNGEAPGFHDHEEDTPISELINEKNLDISRLEESKTKQVSERRKLIKTCEIVLKDTTACPFRHLKSWFRCFFCSKDFMELKLVRDHTNKTHWNIENELRKIKRFPRSLQIDISDLECRQCRLSLTDVDAMRRHLGTVHSKVIYNECIADYKVNTSPYNCHLCKKEFHVFRTLTTHLNEHYANFICDVCGKSFINMKRLKVHKRTHENGAYPCLKCGKVLKTKTSKANHMESAHSKRILKCHICDKPMKHYNDRIKHMSEVHNITHSFKCPFCDRVYIIKHYLATHIRQTHGNKNKKCSQCNMAFITNHGLKKHMLKHSGERPYSCTLCSKAYTRRYTLKEHMREHDKIV